MIAVICESVKAGGDGMWGGVYTPANRGVRQMGPATRKSCDVINPIQTRTADRLQAQRCRTPRLVALTSSVRGPWPTWPESTVRTGPEPNGTLPRASGLAGGAFLRWSIILRPHHRSPGALMHGTWRFRPFAGHCAKHFAISWSGPDAGPRATSLPLWR